MTATEGKMFIQVMPIHGEWCAVWDGKVVRRFADKREADAFKVENDKAQADRAEKPDHT